MKGTHCLFGKIPWLSKTCTNIFLGQLPYSQVAATTHLPFYATPDKGLSVSKKILKITWDKMLDWNLTHEIKLSLSTIKNMHCSSFWDSEILFGFAGNPSNFTQSLVGLIIIHCISQHRNEGASNELNNEEAKNVTQDIITWTRGYRCQKYE